MQRRAHMHTDKQTDIQTDVCTNLNRARERERESERVITREVHVVELHVGQTTVQYSLIRPTSSCSFWAKRELRLL